MSYNREIQDSSLNNLISKIFEINIYNGNRKLLHFKEEKGLNIFLVPHSHCDSGWLKTYEYYKDTVQYILTGVVNQLENDSSKKFNWAEIGYFSKWYEQQDERTINVTKKLIHNGQLEFVTGGWVQNDEATANLDDIIEQMTIGHQWLKENFNYTVEYAWQIDPFGYSSVTPTLFKKMGIKGLVINRVSDEVKNYMKNNNQMEFIWKGSETLGKDSELLVSVLDEHYSYPDIVNPKNNMKLEKRVKKFIKYIYEVSATLKTKNIIIPLGDDFTFSNPVNEFKESSKWLKYIQERKQKYNINSIRYSTLSEYFNQLKKDISNSGETLIEIQQDFLPYNTGKNEFWTGYYSTRPTIKKEIRDVSYLLRTTEFLYGLFKIKDESFENEDIVRKSIKSIRELVSLSQHHDIITGTSRSFVLFDYFEKLKNSRFLSLNIISNLFTSILKISNNYGVQSDNFDIIEQNYIFEKTIEIDKLNNEEYYSIKLFNSLGWESYQHLSFRLKSMNLNNLENLKVYDSSFKQIEIQINSINYNNTCFGNLNDYLLFAIIKVPPIGFSTLFFKIIENDSKNNVYYGQRFESLESDIILKNNYYEWKFSKENGLLKSFINKNSNIPIHVSQNFNQYHSKKSGPYILRAGNIQSFLDEPDYYIIYDGPLVSQLSMIYGSDCDELSIVNQRVYKFNTSRSDPLMNEKTLETSYSFIGEMKKEKIIQYTIDGIKEDNNIFFTDNGIESRKRYRDHGSKNSNYYPSLHYMHLKNENLNQLFTVFFDRSVGCTLSSNNQLEIMLHRTLDNDDSKGISWPSKDKSRVDGKIYFNFDNIQNQNTIQKKLSLQIDYQPIYLIKKTSNILNYTLNYQIYYCPLLSNNLPDNIHFLSLKCLYNVKNNTDKGRIGLRLFNINNYNISFKNYFPLNQYFNDFNDYKLIETGLTFLENNHKNDIINNYIDLNFPIKSGKSEYSNLIIKNNDHGEKIENNTILIKPLEIKSFVFNLNNDIISKNSFYYNDSLYKTIDYNSNQYKNIFIGNSSLNYFDLNNTNESNNNNNNDKTNDDFFYPYDFSVYPINLSHYNDIGKYNTHLVLIVTLTTIPTTLIFLTIVGIVIYKKIQKRKMVIKTKYYHI